MNSHEVSSWVVLLEATTAVRTIANIMVMTTSEKMPVRAAFRRHLIWTPLSMRMGINMTGEMSAASRKGSSRLTRTVCQYIPGTIQLEHGPLE